MADTKETTEVRPRPVLRGQDAEDWAEYVRLKSARLARAAGRLNLEDAATMLLAHGLTVALAEERELEAKAVS